MARKASGGRVELLFLHPARGRRIRAGGSCGRSWPGPPAVCVAGMRLTHRPRGRGRAGGAGWRTAAGRSGPVGTPRRAPSWNATGDCRCLPYIKDPLARPADTRPSTRGNRVRQRRPRPDCTSRRNCSPASRSGAWRCVRVTLHVGLDTFRPITEETVEDHGSIGRPTSVSAESVREDRCGQGTRDGAW